jgi:BON domain-containing protein
MFSSSRTPPAVEPAGKAFAILCSIGIGAALMYFLDPDSGRRRRALAVEKSARLKRSALEKQDALVRDALHRVNGTLAAIRARLKPAEPVDDGVLVERVRAAMGHIVGDPRAVEVRVHEGCVTLKGPVRQDEMGELVACAERVRGVREVDNRLSVSPGA